MRDSGFGEPSHRGGRRTGAHGSVSGLQDEETQGEETQGEGTLIVNQLGTIPSRHVTTGCWGIVRVRSGTFIGRYRRGCSN